MTDVQQVPQQWEIGPDGQPRPKQADSPQMQPQPVQPPVPQGMPPTPGVTAPVQQGQPAPPQPATAGASLDTVVVDMTGATDDDEPLPEAWYKLLVEDILTAKDGVPLKSQSGEPKVTWRFRVAEGPRTGKPVFVSTNISGAGVFAVRKILKVFHGDMPKGPVTITWANYRGQYVWAYVGLQKNNPQYNEIKKYQSINNPPPGVIPAGAGAAVPPQQAPIAGRI